MRGIIGWGTHVPYRRLDRTTIAAVAGSGGGRGTRSVAGFDEDTTTMATEAARRALRDVSAAVGIESLWFATVEPAYLDKTNATAIHAALRLAPGVLAYDTIGAVRSSMGALRAALAMPGPALAVAADIRTGLAGSSDEVDGGDGAAALVVGNDGDAAVLAWPIATAAVTAEIVDRWRTPGHAASRLWEERFGEQPAVDAGLTALAEALESAGLEQTNIDHLVIAGTHGRAMRTLATSLRPHVGQIADDLTAAIGNTGAAQPLLALAATLEVARPDEVVALVVLADGAEVVLWRTTAALVQRRQTSSVRGQIACGGSIAYGKYLAWRGWLAVEPPRRPEPARPSASASARNVPWKYGFVASEGSDGELRLPPSSADALDVPMADRHGTIRTFTVDRLAYSPSPPVVFAVVDFDGGGRYPVELTDVDADATQIGDRVEMTFRRLFTADGIHNYFWKARPVREGTP